MPENKNNDVLEFGQMLLSGPEKSHIFLLSVIGEIEGHDNLPASSKTIKYEYILPQLAYVENAP